MLALVADKQHPIFVLIASFIISVPCLSEFKPDSSMIRYEPFGGSLSLFCKNIATVCADSKFSLRSTSTAEFVGATT